MKRLSIILLVVLVGLASCAKMQQKETVKESGTPSFQPEPLDDECSKWLIGEWEDTGDHGVDDFTIESVLNGQF